VAGDYKNRDAQLILPLVTASLPLGHYGIFNLNCYHVFHQIRRKAFTIRPFFQPQYYVLLHILVQICTVPLLLDASYLVSILGGLYGRIDPECALRVMLRELVPLDIVEQAHVPVTA
jgi:hypothetical protein